MKVIVTKSVKGNIPYYRFLAGPGIIIHSKLISPVINEQSSSLSFFKGMGSLLNVAGPNTPIIYRSSKGDLTAIRRDWERVGQSLLDGVIASGL